MTIKRLIRWRKLCQALAGVLSLGLAACSPVNLLNSIVPKTGYEVKANLAYGDAPRQRLDIYRPTRVAAEPSKPLQPVVLFYYGGSWDSGNKNDYLFVAEAFASKGYVVVIPDYRVYPAVRFPAFMQDPARAMQWVKTHIAQYGGDPDQIFVIGHSAGAHITMLLNLDPRYLAQVGLNAHQFRGFIGLAGPYDFLPLQSDRLKAIFGDAQQQYASQPIHFVNGDNAPTLLLVGLKDGTVWPRNSFHLAAAIQAKHGPVTLIRYPDYGHIDMVAKLAAPLRGNSHLLEDIVQFMQAQTAVNKPVTH